MGFTFCATDPPLLWRQTRGRPSPTGAPGAQPNPRVPSPEHRCTRGLSALHCSSSAPSGSRGALCRSGERQALPEAPVALVTDELDSPLSPGD